MKSHIALVKKAQNCVLHMQDENGVGSRIWINILNSDLILRDI